MYHTYIQAYGHEHCLSLVFKDGTRLQHTGKNVFKRMHTLSCCRKYHGTYIIEPSSLVCIQPLMPTMRCAIAPKHTACPRLIQPVNPLAAMSMAAAARSASPWWLGRHACGRSGSAAASCAWRLPSQVTGPGRLAQVNCLSGAFASPLLCCKLASVIRKRSRPGRCTKTNI